MTRSLRFTIVACGLVASLGLAGCATPRPPNHQPAAPDVTRVTCKEIFKITKTQRAALDDDERLTLGWREARCAFDAGDDERAAELAQALQGARGEAMRDFLDALIAVRRGDDNVESLLSIWISSGHADARAFIREPTLRTVASEPFYIPLALAAWERDLRAGRAESLPRFVRALAEVSGCPFVDGARRAVPGALTIAQGQLIESAPVPGDRDKKRVRMAAIEAQWSVVDKNSWGEGTRTEYYGNWRVTGAESIVTKTESVEVFNTNGHTFMADVPAYALQWKRMVVVGQLAEAGGPEVPPGAGVGAGVGVGLADVDDIASDATPHVVTLLVLPRDARTDVTRRYELNDLPAPPLF